MHKQVFHHLFLLHGFKSNQPIDLALLSPDPDTNFLAALTTIHNIKTDLPRSMLAKQESQWHVYNLRHKEKEFKVGQLVLIKIYKKYIQLVKQYAGP